jgi:hypothetical protein
MKNYCLFSLFSFLCFINASAKTVNESIAILNKKLLIDGETTSINSLVRKGIKKNFLNLSFEKDKIIYKVDVTYPYNSTEFNSEKVNLSNIIKKSYEDQPTPYAGEITNIAKCPKLFKPISIDDQVDNKKFLIIKTLVGQDLSYGLCDKKSIAYAGCTTFYFDEKKMQYFKINIYTSPNKQSCEKITKSFIRNLVDI